MADILYVRYYVLIHEYVPQGCVPKLCTNFSLFILSPLQSREQIYASPQNRTTVCFILPASSMELFSVLADFDGTCAVRHPIIFVRGSGLPECQ